MNSLNQSLKQLQQRLLALESEIAEIKRQGSYLIGVRVERSPAGGTASQKAKGNAQYARLRAGRGKLLPNGKKSLYIPIEKIPQYQAACDRGKQIQQLERQVEQIQAQITKIDQSQYRRWRGKRRKLQTGQKIGSPTANPPTQVSHANLPLPPSANAAILVLYRQHPDAPVHAIAAEIWQGSEKIAEFTAVHCMGMRADRVTAYIKEVLATLHEQFGVTRFEDVVKEIPIHQCPIIPCPFGQSHESIPQSSITT